MIRLDELLIASFEFYEDYCFDFMSDRLPAIDDGWPIKATGI